MDIGRIIDGDRDVLEQSFAAFQGIPIDRDMTLGKTANPPTRRRTLAGPVSVTGSGTFLGKARRTLYFEPSTEPGWWFDRTDQTGQMPIGVSVKNVWTTIRNIVLCSGSPHNYMRMVEHIIALKTGLYLDDVMVRMDSGDPPLFDCGSTDLVDAVDKAGIVETDIPVQYVAVKEPVIMGGGAGSFLMFSPPEKGDRRLILDCAIDFKNAIGKQRIRYVVDDETFRIGAQARTNTNLWMMMYVKTIGRIFADTRNLGYTSRNILVAGPRKYINKPGLIHNGKSLEAVWHRATLDLLAAIALIDRGRFAGTISSYKAGHTLDVCAIRELYNKDILESC